MIAYTITSTNKVWMIDEASGDTIPQWCYNKEGYFVVDKLPNDVQALVDGETIKQTQDSKIAEIKQAFTRTLQEGFICSNGIKMDAELNDIITLKAGYDLALSLNQATILITDYDNVDHPDVALEDVFTMVQELGINYETLRTKKNTLRAQVNAATTQEELEAIVW